MITPEQGQLLSGSSRRPGVSRLIEVAVAALCLAAPLTLYGHRMLYYSMSVEDFTVAAESISWQELSTTLWRPMSTHFCPPFRLLTGALVAMAGSPERIPSLLFWGSMAGFCLMILVLHQFVWRETGSMWHGVGCVTLCCVTSSIFPAVASYTYSQTVWSAAFSLMALLCVQSLNNRFRWPVALGAFLASAVAPAWFSIGLVAGPLAGVYGWLSSRGDGFAWKRLAGIALPTAGTLVHVSIAMALSAEDLLQQGHFGGRSLLGAFRPDIGLYLTARAMSEHLVLWNLAIDDQFSIGQFWVFFSAVLAVCIYALRRSPWRTMAITGVILMLISYWFVYTFRSFAGIEFVRAKRWYVLFPQIGWSILMVCIVFPSIQRAASPNWKYAARVLILTAGLLLLHLPVAIEYSQGMRHRDQTDQLQLLAKIQRVSREFAIDSATLGRWLGRFPIDGAEHGFDGLRLVRTATDGPGQETPRMRGRLEVLLKQVRAARNE